MCDGAFVEDQDHAWKCEFAILKRHDMLSNAKVLAMKDLERSDRITPKTL
jgi:hypothetical protein